MPLAFKPFTVPINLRGSLSRIHEILSGRTLGICLQGKSIEELEKRIVEFKELSLCWGAMNRFDIYQNDILNQINKKLQIVMDVGEVQYEEDYELKIRIPRWKSYLQNPTALLITSEEVLHNIKTFGNWDIEQEYPNQVIVIEKCRNIAVPNSIMLYLMVLTKLQVRKIILFGFDGYGNPTAFKDTPVWDATEMIYPNTKNSLEAYYKPESVLEERRVGYQDEWKSDLASNCPTYNDQFRGTMAKFCKDNNLNYPDIMNCSPNSLYTVHKKITYDELQGAV